MIIDYAKSHTIPIHSLHFLININYRDRITNSTRHNQTPLENKYESSSSLAATNAFSKSI